MFKYSKLLLLLIGSLLFSSQLMSDTASAVTGADWRAGNIISDELFYKSSTMASDDIQSFLNSMVPTCDTWGTQPYGGTTAANYGTSRGYPPPYTCLKDYYENPSTHENNANGGTVSGGVRAADIIKYASDTYRVSPKVLLVLLQKEQSLVTDNWPWTLQYRSATGYGCPDTAPCDAEYFGFYNQVTKAAYQFNRYAQYPSEYRYKPYQDNFIQWNPESVCGGSGVYINSYATAGLYNYTPYQPNDAALANLYGLGDSCSAYGNRNFWRMYNDWFGSTQTDEKFINYKSHIHEIGWTSAITNGGVTGSTGQSRPMQAIKINGEVEYSTYAFTTGWQPTVNRGMISGTTGMNKPIQAIKINPIGSLASRYDIYYRAHVSNVGWMGWTKNGQVSGVTGDQNKNIEAVEIRLVIKDYAAPGSTVNSYQNIDTLVYSPPLKLNMSSHVGTVGWQPTINDTMVSGTTEQRKRIEAVRLGLSNTTGLSGSIVYSAHLAGIGWQEYKKDNEVAGTTGEARQMEAIRIALTGSLKDSYDIWYRGYVQTKGWYGWTKNGYPAGSVGAGLQLEAIEVRVVPKDSINLASNSLYNPRNKTLPLNTYLIYSAHVSTLGWTESTGLGMVAGTTGQSKPLEAIRIDEASSLFGVFSVNCSAYVKNVGWTADTPISSTCGTTGQSKTIEAIRLQVTGDLADEYSITYKTHVSNVGWQQWQSDGAIAGSPGSDNSVEAIIITVSSK